MKWRRRGTTRNTPQRAGVAEGVEPQPWAVEAEGEEIIRAEVAGADGMIGAEEMTAVDEIIEVEETIEDVMMIGAAEGGTTIEIDLGMIGGTGTITKAVGIKMIETVALVVGTIIEVAEMVMIGRKAMVPEVGTIIVEMIVTDGMKDTITGVGVVVPAVGVAIIRTTDGEPKDYFYPHHALIL